MLKKTLHLLPNPPAPPRSHDHCRSGSPCILSFIRVWMEALGGARVADRARGADAESCACRSQRTLALGAHETSCRYGEGGNEMQWGGRERVARRESEAMGKALVEKEGNREAMSVATGTSSRNRSDFLATSLAQCVPACPRAWARKAPCTRGRG